MEGIARTWMTLETIDLGCKIAGALIAVGLVIWELLKD